MMWEFWKGKTETGTVWVFERGEEEIGEEMENEGREMRECKRGRGRRDGKNRNEKGEGGRAIHRKGMKKLGGGGGEREREREIDR